MVSRNAAQSGVQQGDAHKEWQWALEHPIPLASGHEGEARRSERSHFRWGWRLPRSTSSSSMAEASCSVLNARIGRPEVASPDILRI